MPPDESTERKLVRSAFISGLCSMVPVPLLDEALLRKTRRALVHQILTDRAITFSPESVRSLYADPPRGCLAHTFGLAFKLVRAVVKKVFRTVFFFLAVRAAVLAMVETYLLGRTIHHCTARGVFRDPATASAETDRVRQAFRSAMAGADREILATAMKRSWRQLRGRRGLVHKIVAHLRRLPDTKTELAASDLAADEREAIEKSSLDLLHQLHQPEVQTFLKNFDSRFDAALARAQRL